MTLVSAYKEMFAGTIPNKHNPNTLSSDHWKQMAHLVFMLNEIEKFEKDGRIEKAMRWLGFVQGVMWGLRMFTISELKNHNYDLSNQTESPRTLQEAE